MAKDESNRGRLDGYWILAGPIWISFASAASVYNRVRNHHGIVSIVLTGFVVLCGTFLWWEHRHGRLGRVYGLQDPTPSREGRYVSRLIGRMVVVSVSTTAVLLSVQTTIGWLSAAGAFLGLVHLKGIAAEVRDDSLTFRNGLFCRRRSVPYGAIPSLRMVPVTGLFERSRVLQIGSADGEKVRVLAISHDRPRRQRIWLVSYNQLVDPVVWRGFMLSELGQLTGLAVESGTPR